jgi:hypothetical protein
MRGEYVSVAILIVSVKFVAKHPTPTLSDNIALEDILYPTIGTRTPHSRRSLPNNSKLFTI